MPATEDCLIHLRVTPYEMERFLKFREQGISARQALQATGCPCEKCKGLEVIVYNKTGDPVRIKKEAILTKRD